MLALRNLVGIALAATLAAPSVAGANHSAPATYTGTHGAGGGVVEFDVNAAGTALTRIRVADVQGNVCTFGDSTSTGEVPISGHAFSLGTGSSGFNFAGSFDAPQSAQGTLRLRTFGPGSCDSGTVNWTATTTAAPPGPPPGPPPQPPPSGPQPSPGPGPVADTTPPDLTIAVARVQRPGARGALRLRVGCPTEACTASAGGTVSFAGAAATFRLRGIRANLAAGGERTLVVRLPRRARAAVRRALLRGRRVTARLTLTATDAAGNRATARRTVRLRR